MGNNRSWLSKIRSLNEGEIENGISIYRSSNNFIYHVKNLNCTSVRILLGIGVKIIANDIFIPFENPPDILHLLINGYSFVF